MIEYKMIIFDDVIDDIRNDYFCGSYKIFIYTFYILIYISISYLKVF